RSNEKEETRVALITLVVPAIWFPFRIQPARCTKYFNPVLYSCMKLLTLEWRTMASKEEI
ncbi:Protein of unknown function, partial [Gryllus bimaculatus]